MNIFDNFLISDLPIVLREDSLLKRYYDLIPLSNKLCKAIYDYGIKDTNSFFEKIESVSELKKIVNKTNIASEYFLLLRNMLFFYRFRTVKLKKINSFNKKYINKLESINIKDTGSLIIECKTQENREKLSNRLEIPVEKINKLANIADIMRLPGVKDIRATLYFDSGFDTLEKISKQDPLEMKNKINEYIKDKNISKSPPFPKEITTQITWAKIYPRIIN
ncbi:DUF4332 domain-containing protein [Oceanotoga sp. DSM 15011]|uniref:DUF4332 domain-containing protein n=1 Tax=Oceanotoga sp. DSM 15011 TaxID=2984951 RepID=UPI0021F452DB|nr:DUF4332 domain-containing protein [Oceanotoga sp. DSM 15011]UYP01364.1 DUF4332 domain-containing protein [Oceanotoga sp. DSM 15011]